MGVSAVGDSVTVTGRGGEVTVTVGGRRVVHTRSRGRGDH